MKKKYSFTIINTINFLICFLPIALIIGNLASNLIVYLVSILFFILSIKKKINIYNNFFFKFFFIFWLLISIRSFFADKIIWSLSTSLMFIRFYFFIYAIYYVNKINNDFKNKFSKFLLVTLIILILDSYFQFFFGYNFLGMTMKNLQHDRLISSFFGSELILGSYLLKFIFIFMALILIKSEKKSELFFYYSMLLLIFILIILSGERVALFLYFIGFLYILLLNKKKKLNIIFLATCVFTLLIISHYNKKISGRFFLHSLQQIGIIKNESASSNKIKIFSENHEALYKVGINMFLDNPIFGQGVQMFRVKCSEKDFLINDTVICSTHPHNYYIQLLAETGLFGSLFLFIYLIYFIYLSILIILKKKIISQEQLIFLGLMLVIIFPLTPSGNFFGSSSININALSLGFILSSFYNKNL